MFEFIKRVVAELRRVRSTDTLAAQLQASFQ